MTSVSNGVPIVFITGATGKIGGALVDALRQDAKSNILELRLGVRDIKRAEHLQSDGVTLVEFDYDKPKGHRYALTGVDRLFVLTGYSVDMLAQSKAIIDAAVGTGVKHIVHMGAYAKKETRIAHLGWHRLVEAYLEQSGIQWTHLRPNWFMQNVPFLENPIGTDEPILHGFLPSDRRVSWIDTDDIATVAAAVLRNPQLHVNVGYDLATEAKSYGEIAELLSAHLDRTVQYEQVPRDSMMPALRESGMEEVYARCIVDVAHQTGVGAVAEAEDVFPDTFQQIARKAPITWQQRIAAFPRVSQRSAA